jgi:hypothetical protein
MRSRGTKCQYEENDVERKEAWREWMEEKKKGMEHAHKEIDDRISDENINKSFAAAKYWNIWFKSPKSLDEHQNTEKTFIWQHGNPISEDSTRKKLG